MVIFSLEILAFPFDHADSNIEACREELEASERKGGRKVHVMEVAKINGEGTHPVFRHLKGVFDLEEMDPSFAHYFFVNPDGNTMEMHYGASYNSLKRFVDRHVEGSLGRGAGGPRF